jgi:ABC-type glycerol-3-phosphate transport system permease component
MIAALRVVLVIWAILPLVILVFAALLSDTYLDSLGIRFPLSIHEWKGLRLERLFDPVIEPLWYSALRTLALAATVSAIASTIAVLSGYLVTRLRNSLLQRATEISAILAYSLPTIFLLIVLQPLLPKGVFFPPEIKVGILHFSFVFPLAILLSLSYSRALTKAIDRSAAVDGASWPGRFLISYWAELWRAHLAIFSICLVVSWGDLLFSNYFFQSAHDKLIVDLYVLSYFDESRTASAYSGAALFGVLVLGIPALIMAFVVAMAEDR